MITLLAMVFPSGTRVVPLLKIGFDVIEWDSDRSDLRSRLPASALVDVMRDIEERTE